MLVVYPNTPILDYEGAPMKVNAERNMCFKDAVHTVCNQWTDNEVQAGISPENKARAYRISMLMFSGETVELDHDDIAFIKQRAGVIAGINLYGEVVRICDLAAPAVVPGEDEEADEDDPPE